VDHVPQQPHDLLAGLLIELPGRLIGQQQPRPDRQRPGDGHPLLLPARKLTGPLPRVIGQSDQVEHPRHPLLPLPRGDPGDPQRDPDVLRRRQHRQQAERLEDVGNRLPAQPDPVVLAHRPDVSPGHPDRSAVRRVQSADHVEESGLARPGPAAQRHQLSLAHAEGDPAQRGGRRRAAAVGAGHVPHVDHGGHLAPSALSRPALSRPAAFPFPLAVFPLAVFPLALSAHTPM
jgi:hypothetical protein